MGRYTKALDLYDAQRAYFARRNVTMVKGHSALAAAGLKDARELTSGSLTPAQTKGAFARVKGGLRRGLSNDQVKARGLVGVGGPKKWLKARGLLGIVPLLPINKQSGQLNSSFFIRRTGSGPGTQTINLGESSPGGGIFRLMPGGTVKMVDSGFFPDIRKRWKARNAAFLDHFRDRSGTA